MSRLPAILPAVMGRVLAATPRPLRVTPGAAGVEVCEADRAEPVAVMRRHGDADLFASAAADLRALAEALSETWHRHRPDGDGGATCRECGQPCPCGTRRLIAAALAAPDRRADQATDHQ